MHSQQNPKTDENVAAALNNLVSGGSASAPLCSAQPLFHIDGDGHWHYLTSPLPEKFARLFMSVLRPDEDNSLGGWALVTPVERVRVSVSREPVVIVDVESQKDGYRLLSVLGHEYLVAPEAIETAEYGVLIHLPGGLRACMTRACFYRFAQQLMDTPT